MQNQGNQLRHKTAKIHSLNGLSNFPVVYSINNIQPSVSIPKSTTNDIVFVQNAQHQRRLSNNESKYIYFFLFN